MDKISKALKKFKVNEKIKIKSLLNKVKIGDFNSLDIKKLKGRDDIYRARAGKIRIIYRIKNKEIVILAISRRSDNIYNLNK
ncbi:type II toxin-antitoxin system RelE/ParE family toxin [Candidatus Parcubacteria bacterium]|nr:type II toxin-antitoxin system RelE/ParE family toxin [Candidatus Parcubacteria bacterium]